MQKSTTKQRQKVKSYGHLVSVPFLPLHIKAYSWQHPIKRV
jgi:hypothetical protein